VYVCVCREREGGRGGERGGGETVRHPIVHRLSRRGGIFVFIHTYMHMCVGEICVGRWIED